MKVRYTATARAGIDGILAPIADDNPTAAAAVAAAIKAAVRRVRTFPGIGAKTDQPGIYMKIARPYQFLVFYRVAGDTIVIRNVRHPARRRPPNNGS